MSKIANPLRNHDHWFAEWWSAVLLVTIGISGLCVVDNFIIQQSLMDGFINVLPFGLWEWLFITFGLIQFYSLLCESLIGREVAAFLSSALLIWATLNIIFYGQWYFSPGAWHGAYFQRLTFTHSPEL